MAKRALLTAEQKNLLILDEGDEILVIPCRMRSNGALDSPYQQWEVYFFQECNGEWRGSTKLKAIGLDQKLSNDVLLIAHVHRTKDWSVVGLIGMRNDKPTHVNSEYEYLRYRRWKGRGAIWSYFLAMFWVGLGLTCVGLLILPIFLSDLHVVAYNHKYIARRGVSWDQATAANTLIESYRLRVTDYAHYFSASGGQTEVPPL